MTKGFLVVSGAVAAVTALWVGGSYLDPNIPSPIRVVSPIAFTHDELEACAAWAEYNEEMSRPGAKAQDVAMDMEMEGHFGAILEMAEAYDRRFHIPTIYSSWRDAAPKLCAKMRYASQAIVMPPHGVQPGYHIYRSITGSAAIVKDGEPEPQFGCMEGYHAAGFPGQPDGSGGCQPNR